MIDRLRRLGARGARGGGGAGRADAHEGPRAARGLGAFAGVFTPSILTIVGVILFLRLGWVVGHVGLGGALGIIALSSGITLLTALSIASVATDVRVRAGGAYFMISRSLGPEAGGAIGIALYLAQTLSVALYVLGFAESVARVAPAAGIGPVAAVTTLAVGGVALVSSRAAMRVQYVVMLLVLAAFGSILLGGPVAAQPTAEPAAAPGGVGYWAVFAVFFPAVTGIMAGVNLSGDLEDPARAIPRGTLAAVGVGFVLYAGTAWLLAGRAAPATLVAEPMVLARMAASAELVVLGIWASTLSSAVGSLLGAPRVLQALARDGVLPDALRGLGAAGAAPTSPPRRAALVTTAICLTAVLAGGLNAVASLLTMFFLGTYATLNFVAGVETALASPSFRPRFRVPAAVPLLGGVGCVGAMLAIDPLATAVATLAVLALLVALTWRGLRVHFGDVRQGLWTVVARTGLLRLQGARVPESWRPHLLVLTGDPTKRWHLLELARALEQGRGFLSVGAVLPHPDPHPTWPAEMERTIRERLAREHLACMVRVVHAPDLYAGAGKLVDAYGLGAVTPDTILLGPNEDPEELDAYCAMVEGFRRAGRHTLIVRPDHHGGFGARRRIDVWWGGLERNGALMLLLGDLLQRSEGWRDATLTLRTIVGEAAAVGPVSRNLERFVHESRLRSEVDVIARAGRTPDAILAEVSKDADLVILGVGEPDDDFCAYFAGLQERVAALPATLQVMAAEEAAAGLQEAVVDPEAAHEDRARDRAGA